MYKIFIRPILFLFSPEAVHDFLVKLLRNPLFSFLLRMIYGFEHRDLRREVFGITFRNPVGLAAGFDKNAEICSELSHLGFGFIEIGTVTPRAQPGNPKPRIFRLVEEEALINRMGFNNQGADEIAARLKSRSPDVIIGGNIGKNRNTPNEHAVDDYLLCFEKLYDVVDFFIVNVSSPNTPHLRELQEREPLKRIMASLMERSAGKKPILLKIAPDLNNEQLDDIIDIIQETGINGIVATNTTISRDGLHTPEEKVRMLGEGGLSGKPLKARATEVIKYLRERLDPDFPIIGAGGIHSPGDAIEKLKAGANLVELYTGFIYEGPGLLKKIKKTLLKNTNLY